MDDRAGSQEWFPAGDRNSAVTSRSLGAVKGLTEPPLLRSSEKRYTATVGRPEIQKFAGALHGQHVTKGIFITTSDFSRDANDYVSKISRKIVLIDGSRLAELMIEFGMAVATEATYTVKRIDNDFFESI